MIPGAAFRPPMRRETRLQAVHPVLRLGAAALGIASAMVAVPAVLAAMGLVLAAGLGWTGLGPGRQLASLRPWWFAGLLVLAVHVLTTTDAAPLGHPSWGGLAAGLLALGRVLVCLGWLALTLRTSSVDDLVGGVQWWLRPLARLGVPTRDLGLVLAVALGTAPRVLGEGRRIEAVVRLRRGGGDTTPRRDLGARLHGFLARRLDQARVIVPLLESLVRKGESLSLSLRDRRPQPGAELRGPAWSGLALLGLWAVALGVAAALGAAPEGSLP